MKLYSHWHTESIQINEIGLNWWTWSDRLTIWLASAFLVSVPVFFQAPLVRQAPWLSLILTVGWLAMAEILLVSGDVNGDCKARKFGSLMWGFSLSWFCGTAYWGWLRFEPLWHLPVEAIALPWAVWAITKCTHRIGGWFYLASLLGTAVTDLYFFLNNLIPYWRAIAELDSNLAAIQPVFQDAVTHLQTIGGVGSGVILAIAIIGMAIKAMASSELHSWSFAGALISTIFVDALFAIVACIS